MNSQHLIVIMKLRWSAILVGVYGITAVTLVSQ